MRQPQEIKIKYKGKGYIISAMQIAYACTYFDVDITAKTIRRLITGRDWIIYHKLQSRLPEYVKYLEHLTKYAHLVAGLDAIILEEQMSCV